LEPSIKLDIRFTTIEVGADIIAKEALTQGVNLIIASGGDGTLSAAAGALVGTNIPIGLISRGTANALLRLWGCQTPLKLLAKRFWGATRIVDAARCNDLSMVLLAGVGFEAETVDRADRQAKNRFGVLAYMMAGFKSGESWKPLKSRLKPRTKLLV
jgi:diacylglycerol kinase family enzyme